MRNVRIAMGEELVTRVASSIDKATGDVRTIEVQESARDAAAANRALELLGKKLDMFKERPAVEITTQVRRIERVIVDPIIPDKRLKITKHVRQAQGIAGGSRHKCAIRAKGGAGQKAIGNSGRC